MLQVVTVEAETISGLNVANENLNDQVREVMDVLASWPEQNRDTGMVVIGDKEKGKSPLALQLIEVMRQAGWQIAADNRAIEYADHHKPRPRFGSARGLIKMAENFDEPLEDFEDYM